MRLTTQIKKLASDTLILTYPADITARNWLRARTNIRRIYEIADRLDARTGTIDPSRKKRGK